MVSRLKGRWSRLGCCLGLAFIAVLLLPAGADASTLISQGFLTNSSIAPDSLVSLQNNTSDYVSPATLKTDNTLLGVTVNSSNAEVSLSAVGSSQVEVATNGVEPVLVSDINGPIQVGDPITVSPIKGVGMKATANTKIIGISQDSFPNSTASSQSVNNQKVKLGTAAVLINVAYYFKQPDKTIIPQALQNIVDSLAGKTVNTVPIILSIVVFLVSLVVIVSVIYSLIHGSIISVGRNPLSQSAVYRNVIHLSILVVGIIAVTVIVIYMILTRL